MVGEESEKVEGDREKERREGGRSALGRKPKRPLVPKPTIRRQVPRYVAELRGGSPRVFLCASWSQKSLRVWNRAQ
jgi:hypothetical protein